MNTKKTTWRFWLSLVILLVLVLFSSRMDADKEVANMRKEEVQ